MPCLLAAVAIAMPRLAIVLLFFFSGWFDGVFRSALWPALGFFFLPTTLLWYSAVQNWFGGEWTFWPIVGVVLAVAIDTAPARRRKVRDPR